MISAQEVGFRISPVSVLQTRPCGSDNQGQGGVSLETCRRDVRLVQVVDTARERFTIDEDERQLVLAAILAFP